MSGRKTKIKPGDCRVNNFFTVKLPVFPFLRGCGVWFESRAGKSANAGEFYLPGSCTSVRGIEERIFIAEKLSVSLSSYSRIAVVRAG